uniref:NADH-ubiquinone oxidoreductase chain 4L n=1 Tax=Amphipsalta zelandica TaxID=1232797 RepID=A0A3Q8GAZ5_9HEMI|nr:NADH dehydrogenase subunit 4L [Amphipsalta zelandica]
MNMSLLICYVSMFISGMVSLCMNRKHLMTTLLSLELIILSMFCCLSFIFSVKMYDLHILLVFLVFSVCEGVMGLSCLVMLIRSHNNDKLMSMSMKTC